MPGANGRRLLCISRVLEALVHATPNQPPFAATIKVW